MRSLPHMAFSLSQELKNRGVTAASETPLFVGRGIAAPAADPNVGIRNGRVYASWDLGEEYGVTDGDGTRPHFVRWLRENEPAMAARWKKLDAEFYEYWGSMPYEMPGG